MLGTGLGTQQLRTEDLLLTIVFIDMLQHYIYSQYIIDPWSILRN